MSPKRGDRVTAPLPADEWDVRFGAGDAVRGDVRFGTGDAVRG
ncbi:hypothetical protein [Streptosporangium roseum]|uniref:Uncharacterized protein n=1 Tax=Streptosporangium roseum (strain ATCC 12428 / DSM 43021 / JCM 3005 / KCTC 9067 / NCIMB 10171 / NRRL 2505 / NI 9100) TaxID=479432 RepID=D2B4E2_STRRD|nr:hypothetical protein [Streptosporangium roseum]ACZ83628.1 hypothetical protein Sros_0605 [Streptosporangium roseum DSM 43021]